MKFPGQRKSKHYFPVENREPVKYGGFAGCSDNTYVIGVDQTLVDIEAKLTSAY